MLTNVFEVTSVRKSDLCSLCFDYAMDDLTVFERHRYGKHLKTCIRCQTEFVELSELRRHAETSLTMRQRDAAAIYLHPFGHHKYWLALSAMVVVLGLTFTLPHHKDFIGRVKETAYDVNTGITDHISDLDLFAHRVLLHQADRREGHPMRI